MAKLFIFAVGGSGSRVLKSLVMLLSSGVKINASEVIPIIVDPHQGNKDLKRTVKSLNNYKSIYKQLGDNRESFFSTKITTLKELVPDEDRIGSTFSFDLKGIQNERFQEYIDFTNLDPNNQALASLLFSKPNLRTEMDIGFVGNPNIGSVVLNQFKESQEFISFASNFNEGDRIFIISSIFGGTGAAGFPIILKNIRNAQPDLPNHGSLRDAIIGGVTILPYFGVAPSDNNKIDKATFISKTKAALSYYESNLSDTRRSAINALYYIGDVSTRDYENDPGGGGQKNDAHFIELASAMAIIDFMNELSDSLIPTSDGVATDPVFKEFGIKQDKDSLDFTMLGNETQSLIAKQLSQYMLFHFFVKNQLAKEIGKGRPFAEKREPRIDSGFTTAPFFKNYIQDINQQFEDWIRELARNKRGFAPFNLSPGVLSEFLNGIETKRGMFGKKSFDYKKYVEALNSVEKDSSSQTAEKKFIDLFHQATDKLLTDYYDYFKSL